MKIVVLAGGTSTERDVSLVSGKGVYGALKSKGHQVVLVDVYLGMELSEYELEHIFESDRDFAEGIVPIGESRRDIAGLSEKRLPTADGFFGKNVLKLCRMADVVFLALHGMNGEDGRIQATFDLMGIKYTGTDYVSSTLAMDKNLTKDLFLEHGVPTPAGFGLHRGEPVPENMVYPCIIKASHGGSSVGVFRAQDEAEFKEALEQAYEIEDDVVIEQLISGDEYTDLVMDGKAYPIVKIIPNTGEYDYKNKYQAGSTTEICPAPISDELTAKIQEAAVKAYEALRLKIYARMDFMVDKDGNVFCLEANTLPGMTPTSLIPQEAAAVGISYEDLCDKLIELSLKKYED